MNWHESMKFHIWTFTLALVSIVIQDLSIEGADWPLWRHDGRRSASSSQGLPEDLHLQWVLELPRPRPAWGDDQEKLLFDHHYEPILLQGKVFVPSMVRDRLTCYDASTGKELWRFYADGPVRLAAAGWEGRVYFSSDDGYLYCLDAGSGALKWRFRGGPAERWILGNGRLISSWPARGAPVVQDGAVYFAASIWPCMGIFIHALDARTGKPLWTNSGSGSSFILQQHSSPAFAGVAPQGYLAATEDRLLVAGGRTVPAVFDRQTGTLLHFNLESRRMGSNGGGGYDVLAGDNFFINRGKLYRLEDGEFVISAGAGIHGEGALFGLDGDQLCAFEPAWKEVEKKDRRGRTRKETVLPKLWTAELDTKIEDVFIQCGDRVYCRGKNGKVLAVDLPRGEGDPKISWSAQLPDEARSMIAGDGKLIISTEAGRLYCFGEKPTGVSLPPPKKILLVERGATWKFLDDGSSPDPEWFSKSFDDSAWRSGPAPLGYGEETLGTTLSYGPDKAKKPITCYFRRPIQVPPGLRFESLELGARVDDGAAFYLNGKEVGRLFLPKGELRPDTRASQGTDEKTYYRISIRDGILEPGRNILAVEVHQVQPSSSDLLFDLELQATPVDSLPPWEVVEDVWTARARKILELSRAREGYCLALGLGTGRLATELARQSSLHVIVIDPNREKVDAFRRSLDELGVYGERIAAVAASHWDLELPAYVAELLVTEDPEAAGLDRGATFVKRVFHTLHPFSGRACFPCPEERYPTFASAAEAAHLDHGSWSRSGDYVILQRTAAPTGSADWTHQYADAANTVVSKDIALKAPLGLLWFGGPSNAGVLPRHGHGPAPQVAGGRLFIEGRDMLRATDIYTGRLLWERKLPDVGQYYDYTSHEPGANAIGGNTVSLRDGVYVLHRHHCLRLDPATGETLEAFTLPESKIPQEARQWAFLAARGDLLFAGAWPVDFSSPEFSEYALSGYEGRRLRFAVSMVSRLKDFEPASYEWARKIYLSGAAAKGDEFRDEDDVVVEETEVDDSTSTGSQGGGRGDWFRRFLISDKEWNAHSEAEHRAYLLANLNKLLLEDDMMSKIPERAFGFRRQDTNRKSSRNLGEKLKTYLEEPGSKPSDRKALILKREILNRRYRFPDYEGSTPGKFGSPVRTGSRILLALDRHTGKYLWEHRAAYQFRHSAIAAGGNSIFCIDILPAQEASYYRRRGLPVNEKATVLALDARTGDIRWMNTERVFGTWLSYSEEHDVLIQAGARGPDRSRDEPGEGIVAYNGTTGKILWQMDGAYSGPCLLLGRRLITQGYTTPGFALDLLTGEKVQRSHPISGTPVDWGYTRKYGCNTAIGSPNLLTFRSAAAGYYDLLSDCGTSNLGGIRSGCTSNLIPAGGILNAPDYTRTCTCSYQNQVSAAFIHTPEAQSWSFSPHRSDGRPAKKIGLNLGAPGDRLGPDGTLWLDVPSVGGESPDIPVELQPRKGDFRFLRHHESRIVGGELSWVTASTLQGEGEIVLHLIPPQEIAVKNQVGQKSPLRAKGAILSTNVPPSSSSTGKNLTSLAGNLLGTQKLNATIAGYRELASKSITVEIWVRTSKDHDFVDARTGGKEKEQGFVLDNLRPRVRYFVADPKEKKKRKLVTIESKEELQRNQWAHLAFTYNAASGLGSLYIDGKLLAQEDGKDQRPLVWDDPTPDLIVGAGAASSSRMDELRISNRALKPEEFLMVGGKQVKANAVTGYWRMEPEPKEEPDLKPYTVRLYFSEPESLEPGERTFQVALQGQVHLKNFDIRAEAGEPNRTLIREFKGIQVEDTLRVQLTASGKREPLLSGIQVLGEW